MPLHIGELDTEVTAVDGDDGISEAQMRAILRRVAAFLEEREREAKREARLMEVRTTSRAHPPAGQKGVR